MLNDISVGVDQGWDGWCEDGFRGDGYVSGARKTECPVQSGLLQFACLRISQPIRSLLHGASTSLDTEQRASVSACHVSDTSHTAIDKPHSALQLLRAIIRIRTIVLKPIQTAGVHNLLKCI